MLLITSSTLQGETAFEQSFCCRRLMVLSVPTVPAGAETKMSAERALWSHADEEKLRALIFAATDIHAIAQKLDRTPLAVRQRAKKLGLTFRKIAGRCSSPLSIHSLSRGSDWLDPNRSAGFQ
jgi:hypothetical protein